MEHSTIDTPSEDLLADLSKKSTIITRPLIDYDESLPHRRTLGLYSTCVLFIGRMLGSGIFGTPGLILKDSQGSYTLYLFSWIIGGILAYTGLNLYLEFGSYLPVNGATKRFLEYSFPRPKFFTTIVYGSFAILFSISSANALLFGEYFRYSLGFSPNEFWTTLTASALILGCGLLHFFNREVALRVQGCLAFCKMLLWITILMTCFYVLFTPRSYTHLPNNISRVQFRLPEKVQFFSSSYSTALLKCIHTFGGWTTAHTVQNEIKNPIDTLKLAGRISILLTALIYAFLNISYLMILTPEELIKYGQLAGALFFNKIYGEKIASQFINLLVSLNSATNVLIAVYSSAIMNQEIFRQGFLPLSEVLCTNAPKGTPSFGILIHCCLSIVVLLIPSTSLYNLIISSQYYPNQLFHAILCLALLFKVRKRFSNIHAPIRANTISVYVCLLGSVSVVISPFLSGRYNFTLYSYGFLGLASVYWALTTQLLPNLFGYKYKVVPMKKADGLIYFKWIKT
ncbi:hypothetical protein OGAPHI_001313 [Ogataea philodendri]|uniref:Uncharacterized protein n=1 Tax=Ogataea philodendri TaxID=1378263 RepID=A0A9P8PGF3_9ASCO|nr:uncharacterized protein OGAPHI_001313 [Ogataea philodendri]KAH3670797.1 hypothetical protein OGAPHI_001313 [Ogataea philodendri]